MSLYAFALTNGSGKSFYAKKHPNLIDVDDIYEGSKKAELREQVMHFHNKGAWLEEAKFKTDLLKEYIKRKYDEDNNLILLLHDPYEAEQMNATLLGFYKIPYNQLLEIKGKWAREPWKMAKLAEIKTHREIESSIQNAIAKYL